MTESIKDKVTIEISSDLYRDLKDKVSGSGFASVEDFVNYVLRVTISKKTETELSKEDTESVTTRLRQLGYI